MKFDANSSYSKEFPYRRGKSADNSKPADQFSMTGSWLGSSTYQERFQDPKKYVSKGKNNYLSQSFYSESGTSSNFKNASSHFSKSLVIKEQHISHSI